MESALESCVDAGQVKKSSPGGATLERKTSSMLAKPHRKAQAASPGFAAGHYKPDTGSKSQP